MNSTLTLTPTLRADKIFSGDQDSVKLYFATVISCVSHDMCHTHEHSVMFGQRDDRGCQSTDPIRRITRTSLGLCPLKDCHHYIGYMGKRVEVCMLVCVYERVENLGG